MPVLDTARQLSHRPARVYEVIRAIYRWAISRDILAVDPTFGMKPPLKKERPRERALTSEEIKQFWTRLGDTPLTEGVQLALKLALAKARQQVVVFTPHGFHKQEYVKGEKDAWGMNGTYWQTHRSGWTPEDFDESWRVIVEDASLCAVHG